MHYDTLAATGGLEEAFVHFVQHLSDVSAEHFVDWRRLDLVHNVIASASAPTWAVGGLQG